MFKTAAFALFVSFTPISAWSATAETLIVEISSGWKSLQQDVSVDQLDEREAELERVTKAVETLLRDYPEHDLSVRLNLGETVGTLSLGALREQRGRLIADVQQQVWDTCRELPDSACLLETVALLTAVWEYGPQPASKEKQIEVQQKVIARLIERGETRLLRLLASHLLLERDLAQWVSVQADILDGDLDVAANRVRTWLEAGEAEPELALFNLGIALRVEQPSFIEQYFLGETAVERIASRVAAMDRTVAVALQMTYWAVQDGNLILAEALLNVAISAPDLAFEGGATSQALEIAEDIKAEGYEGYADAIYHRILRRGPSSDEDSFRMAYMAIAHAGLGDIDESIRTLAAAPDGLPYAKGKIYSYAIRQIGFDRTMSLNWPLPLDVSNLMEGARILAEVGDMNAATRAFEMGMELPAEFLGPDGTAGIMLARDASAAGNVNIAASIIDRLIARNADTGYILTGMLRNGHTLMTSDQIAEILSSLSRKRDFGEDYYVTGLAIVGQPARAIAEINYREGQDRIIDSLLSVEEELYRAGRS